MANIQIPNLPVAITLSGTEQVEVVQSGTSVQTTTQAIANLNANGGTVKSITAIAPLYGNTITTTGSIGLNTSSIDNTYLATMPANTIKGNNTAGVAQPTDLTVAQTMTLLGAAPLASPAFTGTPTAPTPATSDNSTKIATTAYVKAQSAASGTVTSITAGTGLSGGTITTSGTIALANTAVTANSYGSASAVGTFTVNAQGQLTSASTTSIAIDATQIATGTITIAQGGTGQTTKAAAFNALSPITTAGDLILGNGSNSATRLAIGSNATVLTSNGTTASWSAIPANVSSFTAGSTGFTPNTATTGAIVLAGTLNIANGGTGQTTSSAAFNALSPITSTGDLIIGNGASSATRLAIGTSGYVLTSNGTTASWTAPSAGGTVTSITAGTGLSGGTITTSGTIALANTTVTAASYGSASSVATFTVNAQGQLTTAATTSIAIANTQVSGLGTMSTQNASSVTITGGTIDGTPIGNGTPAAGTFTTLTASSTVSGAGITALFASPPAIGSTAASTGAFTTLTASTSLTSPIHYGGTTASSSLTLQSTSGAGTTDSILFKTGNAGAVTALTIASNGNATFLSTSTTAIGTLNLTNALGPTYGGTGQTAVTQGDLLYGSATNTWSRLADVAVGSVLVSGGVGANPAWSASPTITTSVTTPLVIGGTTASSSLTLQSTSGTGTTDSIIFKTGSGTTAATISTAQNVVIGTTAPAAGQTLRIQKSITGAVTSYGILNNGTIQSDVTSNAYGNLTQIGTAAASFTLTNLSHYSFAQGTIGLGSQITNQFGFQAASLTGATTNYNFYSNTASVTTATISNVALTSNVVTITTSAAHGYGTGQSVIVAATTTTSVNGTFTITSVPSTTTFTYALVAADIASVADTGSTYVNTGRYNFYAVGNAPNSFAGVVSAGQGSNTGGLALSTTNPAHFRAGFGGTTYTDIVSSGTVTNGHSSIFTPGTLAARLATTYTNSAAVCIVAAPAAGTNVTITNAYALYVAAGATQLQGSFTANSTTTLSPANASVTISPTGTGTATLNPATAGTINNMSIGATTPAAGTFTTVSGRVNSRVSSAASSASISADISTYDQYVLTAQAVGLTFNASTTGTPLNGNKMTFRIKDNGTPQTITWTTSGAGGFRAIGVTLPTTTVASKVTYVGCIYNSDESFWDVVAVTTQA